MSLHEKPTLSTTYHSSVGNANIMLNVDFYNPELDKKINEQIKKSAKEIEKIIKEKK